MQVRTRLALFAAGAVTVFAVAFGVGSILDPVAPRSQNLELAAAGSGHGALPMGSGHDGHAPRTPTSGDFGQAAPPAATGPVGAVAPAALPGLEVSSSGYTLQIEDTTPARGAPVEMAFRIISPDGGPVLNFASTHEKQLHLIVVRRDLTWFAHLHPERDGDGIWRVPVDLSQAGTYRFFADFAPAALGRTITLGADVFVAGEFAPVDLPAPSTVWSSEGYEVALRGSPSAGVETDLVFTVRRDGAEVADLTPYLGAFGHLVALRAGDLAYLHTHPVDSAALGATGGPAIRFATTFPTAGRYRLYLNFAHAGTVHTADLTLEIPERSTR